MDREVVKKYLEFINESNEISFIAIKRAFDETFPTLDKYESFIMDEANEIYGDYEVDDIQDVGEDTYADIISGTLIWHLIQLSGNNPDEISAGNMIDLEDKIRRHIDKRFYD